MTELWKADRTTLLTLPDQAYEAYRVSAAVVNKYGEVLIEGTPMPLAGLVAPGRAKSFCNGSGNVSS